MSLELSDALLRSAADLTYRAYLTSLVVAAVVFLFLLDRARTSRRQARVLQEGLRDVQAALRTLSGAGVVALAPAVTVSISEGAAVSLPSRDEGLLTLLFDLYWTGRDAEAAQVFRAAGDARRLRLEALAPPLADYARYLRGVTPAPLHDIPFGFYDDPQPTLHLDQSALREAVEAEPALAVAVSPVRWPSLGAYVPDRERAALALTRSEVAGRLTALRPSALRRFDA